MAKARVLSIISGRYFLIDIKTNQEYIGSLRGKLKQNILPKVGDLVTYSLIQDDNVVIEDIEKRKNDLIRPSICNIDQAFIIFSVKEPDLNLNLLDKFLVNLEYNNIKPLIVFNKWDLVEEKEKPSLIKIIDYYKEIGYQCYITSAKDNILDYLDEEINEKISVFTGQSGVGKSSLLNVLDPTLFLETKEISTSLGRGKHTTRVVRLIKIKNGYIADTPGFGTIDFKEMDEVSIADNFIEFFKLKNKCKYDGCMHLNEPNCKVKEAVEKGIILKSRYDNYVNFITDLRKEKKNDYSSLNFKSKRR